MKKLLTSLLLFLLIFPKLGNAQVIKSSNDFELRAIDIQNPKDTILYFYEATDATNIRLIDTLKYNPFNVGHYANWSGYATYKRTVRIPYNWKIIKDKYYFVLNSKKEQQTIILLGK